MKKSLVILVSACLALMAAVSCEKDNTILYNDFTMGNIVNGMFVSDAGMTYNVVEQECNGRLDTMSRALIQCDVLRQTPGKTGTYDIRLLDIIKPLCKRVIYDTEAPDMAIYGSDPMLMYRGWTSGGYINMFVYYTIRKDSRTIHKVQLIYESHQSTPDTLVFTLRHDGRGEVYGNTVMDSSQIKMEGSYVSFPVKDIIPAGKDHVVVKLNWKWYKMGDDLNYLTETLDQSSTCTLKRPQ